MARREPSKPDLKLVDEDSSEVEEVVRIREGGRRAETVASVPVPLVPAAPERLEKSTGEEFERRSEEPDIDAIIDPGDGSEDVEEVWGKERKALPVPHGWFVLILAGVVAIGWWAFKSMKESEVKLEEVQRGVIEAVADEDEAIAEASEFVDRMERHLAEYLASDTIAERVALVREPERVRPLMEEWYSDHELEGGTYAGIRACHPLTIEGRPFWVVSVAVEEGEPHDFLVEQLEDDRVRIDWETKVVYQPVPWDAFVSGEAGVESGEFRVRLRRDVFYTSDYPEEDWQSYRLTAPGSEEYLFGFVPREGTLASRVEEVAGLGRFEPAAAILKLSLDGDRSILRTVRIDELVSPNWTRIKPWRWSDGQP